MVNWGAKRLSKIERLTTIELWGDLRDRFPNEFSGIAHTPREALQMMYCQCPEIRNYFLRSPDYYQLILKESNVVISPDTDITVVGKTLAIMPVLEGSGSIGRIIGGLALVGVGVLTGGTSLIVAGAVMAAQSLFFGHGDKPGNEETERSEILGVGGLNTAEGNPIPVVYGNDVLVSGLQVLSFSIKSEYTSL